MTSILHIVRNPVSHDSRVLKETGSILGKFPDKELVIAGFHEPGYAEKEIIGQRQVHRWRLATRPLPKDLLSQSIKYAEWHLKLVRHYRKQPLKIIHCHDLGPLAIGVHLKRLTGARLIYDAHELETETHGSYGARQWLARKQEWLLIRHVDQMITVSPSIREWYLEHYPLQNIHLVRNIPDLSKEEVMPVPLRATLGVPDDAVLFLYLGGLGKGRGIEAILDGFQYPDVRHHVLFMGSGPLAEKIEQVGKTCERVHHLSPVPPAEVLAHAAGADVGLCLYEDICLNHRYCLPNKLFESLLAGMPVLASNLPDQARLVKDHKAGWVVEPNGQAIARQLMQLEVTDVRELRKGLPKRVANLRWENEASVLLGIYEELLS